MHLKQVAQFRAEAERKIQRAIERSNNGASDEFDDKLAGLQENTV